MVDVQLKRTGSQLEVVLRCAGATGLTVQGVAVVGSRPAGASGVGSCAGVTLQPGERCVTRVDLSEINDAELFLNHDGQQPDALSLDASVAAWRAEAEQARA